MLLDLLGTPDPTFYSFFRNTDKWYNRLGDIEDRLARAGYLDRYSFSGGTSVRQENRIFQRYSINGMIEDDHIPFLQRGVPILHVIPNPFPDVWHTVNDDRSAVDLVAVENLSKIFRVFIIEYLQIGV